MSAHRLAIAALLALGACNDPAEPTPQDHDEDAVLENGVLTVHGDAEPNAIRVTYSALGVVVERDARSSSFADAVASVEIHGGAGNDVVHFEQTVVADLELTVAGGEGDDEVVLSFAPAADGTEMTLPAVVELGPGSDLLDFRWNGDAVPALNAYLRLQVNGTSLGPEQADEVLVAFEHGDVARPVVIGGLWNGRGPDGAPPPGGDPRSMDLELDFTEGHADVTLALQGGAGPDELDLDVDYSGVSLQQGRIVLDADLNDGDNHVGEYVVTSVTHTHVETSVKAGDGNNVVDLEHELGGDGEHTYAVELGEGDNQTTIRFGDGARGARPTTGTRNVTATYRAGLGRSGVTIESEVVEPLTSVVTVDHGAAEGDTHGRYELQFPWDPTAAPPGAQTVPSQMKVVVVSPAESALDLQVEVGDEEVDDPSGFGFVTFQTPATQQTDLELIHEQVDGGRAGPATMWTLAVRDAQMSGGDGSLVVDVPPALGRLVYLQEALEVGGGATMKVALHGDAVRDVVLAHVLGVSAAGKYDFLADGAAGDDFLALLTRDLVATGAGTLTFDVTGGEGGDVMGVGAPEGLGREGPILHAIAAGAGGDQCYTIPEVPATDCEVRDVVGETLLGLIETTFGAALADVWRK